MKMTKIILTAITLSIMVSCRVQLADLNVDPNESSTGGDGPEVFTSATGYYGLALDGFFNETNGLFAQYVAGGPGVGFGPEKYFIEPTEFNNQWLYSYSDCLKLKVC